MLMQCPDCGSCRRGDGYNRDGWYWLECGRRYNPDTDVYGPPNFYCKTIQLEAECESLGGDFEELHNACLEYLKHPPSNVPARREFAEIVTGGSTAPLKIEVDTEQHECEWTFMDKKGEFGVYGLYCSNPECEEQLYEHQAEAMLNEHGPLKGEVGALREMLNELIDCHYGIKIHHIGDGDGLSKEMTEKIKAHWEAHLGRDR